MLEPSVIEFLGNVVRGFLNYFFNILLSFPGVILAVTIHGFAQALAATALGDKGPKAQKKLTFDPLTHTEPIGFLTMLLTWNGWAAPVSVNMRGKKLPHLKRILAILAGPLANILFAFFGIVALIPFSLPQVKAFFASSIILTWIYENVLTALISTFCIINVNMAVFNLIPLPPLDGFRMVSVFIPRHAYKRTMRYQKYFQLAFMIILLIDRYFLAYIYDAFLMVASFVLNDCFAGLINFIFF